MQRARDGHCELRSDCSFFQPALLLVGYHSALAFPYLLGSEPCVSNPSPQPSISILTPNPSLPARGPEQGPEDLSQDYTWAKGSAACFPDLYRQGMRVPWDAVKVRLVQAGSASSYAMRRWHCPGLGIQLALCLL